MKVKNHAPQILLICCFVLSICIMWPGIVSPDAMGQYMDARNGRYNDHHPPLMGFVWQFLDKIYTGPGLLLLMHLLMLYAAAAILIHIFRDSKFKWWYALLPMVPNVLAYTPLIAKDFGFSFSYLLAGTILAYLCCERVQKHKSLLLILSLLFLFYGTSVKYQARFILPFFTFGIAYCWCNYKFNLKAFALGITAYLLVLQAMFSFNAWLVPSTRQSHSWQLVKLYDLSAMSLALNKPLYPEFVTENPNYSFTRVKELFVTSEVDPLVFGQNTVLSGGGNAAQREELLSYWQTTIRKYPWLYLKIRFKLWYCNLTSTPSSRNNPAIFLKDTELLGPIVTRPKVFTAIGELYLQLKALLQFKWLLPFPFVYFALALRKLKSQRFAVPLLIFNGSTLALLAILYFFSMAATARYLFVCICLVHASHGFAYKCLTKH